MKVIFFGSGNYLISVIEKLNKFDLFVYTTEKEGPLIKYLEENNINYKSVSYLSVNEIEKQKAELGILASFKLILSKEILNSFPLGILNIHPSLLPKYRGSTPVQTALLNGDKTTSVSIIKLDDKLDHGPILAQKEAKIEKEDTAETLYNRLFDLGSTLLINVLDQYIKGEAKLTKQDDSKATFTKSLTKESGFFELNKAPKKETLEKMIKAYHPWPGVWTKALINNNMAIIKFLPENKLQVEGKKPVTLKDFKNGYPSLYEKIVKLVNE